MSELKPCPFCGSPAERKGNRRYRKGYAATIGCERQCCPAKIEQATLRGTVEDAYIHAENVWNRRAQPAKVVDALTRCLYDNVYDHDYWVQTRGICGIDMESAKMMADEILRGFYTPAPCDECTGTSCADCELKDVCITWDFEE